MARPLAGEVMNVGKKYQVTPAQLLGALGTSMDPAVAPDERGKAAARFASYARDLVDHQLKFTGVAEAGTDAGLSFMQSKGLPLLMQQVSKAANGVELTAEAPG